MVDTLSTEINSSTNLEDDIPEEMLKGTALPSQDWSKSQQSDMNSQLMIERQRPTVEQLNQSTRDISLIGTKVFLMKRETLLNGDE